MPRVTVSAWLRTIESPDGPLPEELRHVCLSLARFLSGDGSAGCYPGTRKLAIRVGVSHTAISRRLKLLRNAGWLDVEPRGRGFIYFPAVPDGTPERSSRERGNGNPERATRVTPERATPMERSTPGMERSPPELERLSVTDSLTDSLTEGAASPAPADARSAAPEPEPEPERMTDQTLRDQVRILRSMRWPDARILEKFTKHGMTTAHFAAPVEGPDHQHAGEPQP